ncbi:hypothetical protein, partial [Klebsiella pneumoniae]
MMSLWDALRMNMMISYQELVRTFLSKAAMAGKNIVSFHPYLESAFHCFLNCNRRARNSGASANARIKKKRCVKSLDLPE